MFKIFKSSRSGFTLLETMLSVAILLIVTLMAYEGFLSTLNYAGDTALAERVANENAGSCYQKLGDATNAGNFPTNKANENAGNAIMISGSLGAGGTFKSVLQVSAFQNNGGASAFSRIGTDVDADLADAASFVNTTNRHGFVYSSRTCPEHTDTPLEYFKVSITEGGTTTEKIVARCPNADCIYHSGKSSENALVVKWN